MAAITAKTPWIPHLGDVPATLEYFDGSMIGGVRRIAEQYPNYIAFDFMGRSTTYKELVKNVERCARSLKTIGIRQGDRVTIAMPNCPQAIYLFYAVNLVGAVANMVHPLSSEKELEFYINESESVTVVTLDQFYHKIEAIRENTCVVNVIIASIKDELSKPVRAGYMLTEGRKIQKIPEDAPVIRWNEFMRLGSACFWNYEVKRTGDDPAAILYSGGTTGTTKGILLSNKNFNALAQQIVATNPMFRAGDKMLAAMPLFHGFGLGVCIHSMLFNGGRCILVPRFTAKSYAKLITKYRCNFIAGVPTLYEALLRLPNMEKADLSCLKGVFSGGDSLSVELKKKLDKFLYDHKATIQVREGYGTTETVTACCLTPPHMFKEGSIGLPFPDTYIKIVKPGTDEELPYGEEGEILLAGPTVMKGYIKHPEETAATLRTHADGLTWVYTGDLGTMDDEGFVYFRGRSKRMIISSGYNIYPAQLENILDAQEKIHMSCVIGVPDDYKMQAVKAFVMLKPGVPANDETREEILAYCRKHIAKYAMPREIEFRDELPKTLVGKVAYRVLEEEEGAKRKAAAEKYEMKTIQDVNSALNSYGLSAYSMLIEAVVKDAIHIELNSAHEEEIPLGASKMGGLPDLPDGVEWFRHKLTNNPLSFVCQINFAETMPYDQAHKLPDHGILYFFYDASMDMPWGFDPNDGDGRVLYYYEGDLSNLKQASAPDDLEEPGSIFTPAKMKFESSIDFPDLESSVGEKLPLKEGDVNKYYEMLDGISEPGNKLLGHSNNIQGGMELECELVSNNLYCGNSSGYVEGHARGLDKNTNRWNLLLQVDSNEDLGMVWGDAGRLYVWITEEDLEEKNFQASWVILQCY